MTKEEAFAKLVELPETPKVSVLRVEPGDVICVEFPCTLSYEGAERCKEYLQPLWPNNRVVIIGDGGTVKVMKQVEDKPGVFAGGRSGSIFADQGFAGLHEKDQPK